MDKQQVIMALEFSLQDTNRVTVMDSVIRNAITLLSGNDADGERYRFCRDNWSKLTTVTVFGDHGNYVEKIYLNTFGQPLLPESIDEAIDQAIAARDGT